MNDDITTREIELVAAILNALHEKLVSFQVARVQDGNFLDGYTDALYVVNDVLDERGFDVTSLTAPRSMSDECQTTERLSAEIRGPGG